MINKLSERLLSEGYSENNHPDYVKWHGGYRCFEYTPQYLYNTVWETPCGLLKKGIHSYNHGSHLGVTYCPENDNPRYGCPFYDEVPCSHRFDVKLDGWNCAYHLTDKPYDYDMSVEKLWKKWDEVERASYERLVEGFPDGVSHCFNICWNRRKRKHEMKFVLENCIYYGCKNSICTITRKKRDLRKVNIYYDELVETVMEQAFLQSDGTFTNIHKSIMKDKRLINKNIAHTDAELFLSEEQLLWDKLMNSRHAPLFYYEDWLVQSKKISHYINFRIQAREKRDLISDLEDVRNGIAVTHASDLKAATAEKKRERKKKRQAYKARKHKKSTIDRFKKA